MRIDRQLFFVLTGTLAGIACNATDPPGATRAAANPTSPTPTAATTAAAPTTPSAPTLTTASTTPPSQTIAPAPAPAPAPTLAPAPATAPVTASLPPVDPSKLKPLGMDQGCGKSGKAYDAARTGCDDTQGAAPECSSLGAEGGYPSNEVCPGAVFMRRRCFAYATHFKPKVAVAAVACLGTAKMEYCNSCKPFSCGHEALMSSCPDPSADADCETIGRSCSGVDKTKCSSYLSGMTAKGRQAMVSCLTATCSKGFERCLETLQ